MRFRVATVIIISTSLISLSACTRNNDDNKNASPSPTTLTVVPIPTPTITKLPTPTTTFSDKEQQFLQVAHRTPGLASVSDPVLVQAGHAICTSFDNGLTFNQVGISYVNAGLDPFTAGYLIGASVVTLCPNHLDKIPNPSSNPSSSPSNNTTSNPTSNPTINPPSGPSTSSTPSSPADGARAATV